MKAKIVSILAIVCMLLFSVVSVSALDVSKLTITEVELNGVELDKYSSTNSTVSIKKNDVVPVEVCFIPSEDITAYFEVALVGGDYRELDVRADTGKKVFYKAGVYDCAETEIVIPSKVDIGEYTLRVFSFDTTTGSDKSVMDFPVFINTVQDEIVFDKISMAEKVMAGRELTPKVFIRNNGRQDEERVDVYAVLKTRAGDVVASSNTVYVEELEANTNNEPTEEMLIEVPASLDAGVYDVTFVAEYDKDFSLDTYTTTVVVDACRGECDGKVIANDDTQVIAGATSREVSAAGNVVFPIAIKNEGSRNVAYTVEVIGADFASEKVEPTSFFSVEGGKAEVVNVVLTPKAGAEIGEHEFTVVVKADGVVVEELSLVADVVSSDSAKSWASVKNGLQIGFIVLLVLLILLILIVTLNRFKGDKEEDEELKGQTYY